MMKLETGNSGSISMTEDQYVDCTASIKQLRKQNAHALAEVIGEDFHANRNAFCPVRIHDKIEN